MSELNSAGVPADAVQSNEQALAPLSEYELRNQTATLTGMRFRLAQSWTVRTRAEDASHVLDVAIRAGANQSGAMQWELGEESLLEREAVGKALALAQAMALTMADSLQMTLGPLLYASNEAEQRTLCCAAESDQRPVQPARLHRLR